MQTGKMSGYVLQAAAISLASAFLAQMLRDFAPQ
jgi:hypothetical protein